MNKVLFAIGEDSISSSLRKHLTQHGFSVEQHEVIHADYLEESISDALPNVLIIHDFYLQHNFDNEFKKEDWIIRLCQQFRYQFDDNLRVVYLCERPEHDPFLSRLIAVNVLDIFHKRSINIETLVTQLKDKPRYSNIAHLVNSSYADGTKATSEENESDGNDEQEQETKQDDEHESKSKKKVNVKEKVKKKVVVHEKIVHSSSVVAGVFNLSMKAGSSLLTMMLAKALAKKEVNVSVLDEPSSYDGRSQLYDSIGLRLHFDKFLSLPHAIKDEQILSKHTIPEQVHDGIHWYVTDTQKEKIPNWNVMDTIEMLRYIPTNVTLLDLGYYDLESADNLLKYLDHVFFVLDVSPQELEANKDRIEYYLQQTSFLSHNLILNYWDNSLKNKGIQEIFDLKQAITCPVLDIKTIYKQYYEGKNPYDEKFIQEDVHQTIEKMAKQLIPGIQLNDKSKKRNLIPKLSRN